MTGLEVIEINISVFDVHVPDEGEGSEDEGSRSRASARAVSRAPGRPWRPHGAAFTVVQPWTTGP